MKYKYLLLLCLAIQSVQAQWQERIIAPKVNTTRLFPVGNPLGFPIVRLGLSDQLELHFDDLDDRIKNYAYTFQLCNADWTTSMLSQFDFIKGYSQIRITNYRVSSEAFTRYIHYQASVPDRSCMPFRSGNYILKVFQDGDTSKLVFTKRFLIVNEQASISAQILQPFSGATFRTHQKIQLKVGLSEQLQVVNPAQQFKVVILQNRRWDGSSREIKPSFYSRNQFEFNAENDCIFPAGKEWRWLDLRSFRLQSDRVDGVSYQSRPVEVFVKPDMARAPQRYAFYRDMNGLYNIETIESINPVWQGDYAKVHFTFVPQDNKMFPDKEVKIIGLLNPLRDKANAMIFDPVKGVYESTLMLKQGFYNYAYVVSDKNKPELISFDQTEGNYWETENDYQILVYFRGLSGRADELVGFLQLNSITGRAGVK